MGAFLEYRLTLEGDEPLRIWCLGDLQLGSAGAHKELFKRVLKLTQHSSSDHLILMGDLIDAIAYDDPRFDQRHLDSYFLEKVAKKQRAYWTCVISWLVSALKPYKNRILAYLTGNHEEAVAKRWSDPSEEVATRLNILDRYVGYEAIIHLQTERAGHRRSWNIICHHGAFGGMTIGGLSNRLQSYASQWRDADVVAWGHSHQCQAILAPPRFETVKRGHLTELYGRNVWLLSTGSFFRSRPDRGERYPDIYAVKSARPPTVLGCGLIEIRQRSCTNKHFWSIEARAIPAELLFTLRPFK